jgi:hypothetical protein
MERILVALDATKPPRLHARQPELEPHILPDGASTGTSSKSYDVSNQRG